MRHSADGRVGGVFTAVSETTERVLGERRMQILRELAARTAESKSVREACRTFAEVLGENNPDIPFALLYLVDDDCRGVSLSASAGLQKSSYHPAGQLALDAPSLKLRRASIYPGLAMRQHAVNQHCQIARHGFDGVLEGRQLAA